MKECPTIGKACTKHTCHAYCTYLKAKLYEVTPELVKCPECSSYLIPYQGIFLHPDVACKYADQIEVKIHIHSKEYEEVLGKPKESYQKLIESLLVKPKNWFEKLFKLKD